MYAMGKSLALVLKYTEKVNAGDRHDGLVTGQTVLVPVIQLPTLRIPDNRTCDYGVTLAEVCGSREEGRGE